MFQHVAANHRFGLALLVAVLAGCRPSAPPLQGAPVPAVLPRAELPPVHLKYVFKWVYFDGDTQLNGDGAARISPPDSARLDFFLARGMGSGHVLLIGNDLRTPGPNQVRVLVPPPPLLWASLGRLDVPGAPDTVARAAGDTRAAQPDPGCYGSYGFPLTTTVPPSSVTRAGFHPLVVLRHTSRCFWVVTTVSRVLRSRSSISRSHRWSV